MNEQLVFLYIYINIILIWLSCVRAVDDNLQVPPEYSNCSCRWTDWMNSDDASDGRERETFRALRDAGYEFCSEPVDIQCFNIAADKLIDPTAFGPTCSTDIGLSCDVFCDDHKIRVACCYCPPKPIGPKFNLVSEHGQGCLTVSEASSSLAISSVCDLSDSAQLWSWVSTNQIKNELKQQCISVNDTRAGSRIVTSDCHEIDSKQRWDYDKSTRSLSEELGYLSARNGRYTHTAADSKWMAKVERGSTDLSTMQGFPCAKEPLAPSSGTVDCTFGSYQGSECHFSCDYGFKLPPGAQYPIVCMKNRQYNGTTPTCQEITCSPELTAPQDGTLDCTKHTYLDSSCVFSCNHGYRLEGGSRQSICLESGKWDELPPPRCDRIKCSPDLVEEGAVHGSVNCSNRHYMESRCFYSCDQGYELTGAQQRYCTAGGQWDTSAPECTKIKCPTLPDLHNGRIVCSDARNFMSSCQFSCDRGYTMVGSGSTSCTSLGTWGSSHPTCKRKTCSELSTPENGFISCTEENYFSSVCSFRCKDGYNINGYSTLECTAEGWDHGAPECKRITCSPRLLSPIYGNMSCSEEEFYDSQCTFACQEGYQVKGSKAVVCGATGWNDSSPLCKKRHCPKLRQPANGKVVCHPGNEFGSFCFFSCDEGYALPSTAAPVLCTLTGTWSGPAQRCKRIQCRRLTSPRKGSVSCTDNNNFKSKCTFKCNDGFNLYGSTGAVCGVNGWDAQAPTCGRILCTPLPEPSNGQIVCSSRGTLSCTFSCNSGFRLVGSNVTTCRSDETWNNNNIPTCLRLRCGATVTPFSHGSMTCTDGDLFGSVCNYTCKAGFERLGEQLSTCTDTGSWDQSPPTCKRVSCPKIPPLNHGTVTCTDSWYYPSVCSMTCGVGYELIGSESARCQLDKTWSHRSPYCEQITCSPGFSNPSNGRVKCTERNNFASVCSFQCGAGFRLEGNNETRCGTTGWSVATAPSCKKITCPGDSLSGGAESCTQSDEFNSECTYKCSEGYELIGQSRRRCTDAGEWSNPMPTCRRIQCVAIGKMSNMEVHCSKELEYNSECAFQCHVGFRRVGISKAVCAVDKTWQPSKMPHCELIPTSAPTTNTSTTSQPASAKNPPTQRNTVKTPTNVVGGRSSTQTPPESPTNSLINENTDSTLDMPASGEVPIIPIVAGGVAALIVILILILIARWRRNKRPRFSKGIQMQESRYDDSQLQKLIPNGSSNRRFQSIPLDRLESEFTRKHADDDKLFREEFSSLLDGHGSREQGGKVANKEKNRYTNIIPYDHSRVVLPKGNGDSDYINASFVDGYKHKGKFIAAQGPKESTINDFWRMVWDQNVATIIMVTNLVEGKESKCSQYWPLSGSQLYGDLNVVFSGENHLVDYTVRKFTIQQVRGDATLSMRRNLMHYHFTSWPDFGVPKTPSGMLKFLRKIKQGSATGYGAIVVHCSAGVGRTGTFICIDAMIDMMLRESKVDVYGFVSQMRSQRPEMVQTEQQYIFIYQALLEHHLYGDTEVEATEMSSHIDDLNQRLPGNVTGMEHEFKKLTTIRIQKDQMRAGNHPANMRKNRVLLILPYDWNRVILPVKRGVENSDYINASYIDGYRQKDAYIATQGPLSHTVEDFWRLIWESKSASIVMLTELVERGQAKCEQYWPDSGAMVYGDLNVDNISEDELDHYTTRDFVLTSTSDPSDGKQMVRQFHYHGWPESGPPVSGFSMITLVEQVQKQQQTSGNHPITIHCSAGAGRTGAFCALSTALEQVKAEGVLDMFQIVKCLRMQRPHMVQNLEQYEFCYRAVQEYIDSMSEYYNFK